ncbi:MAG TPA: DUF2235 domain-containing protein [Verrucomicrobiae bacterium]|nr:DUF2235 domain-containing protein [Verrucomicrobiae bacterium]
MPKNIVICCDGTANEFAGDRTNVIKLYYTLEQNPATQIAFYHPGLGTMEPAGALTTPTRKITRVLGMAVGYGLSHDITDAYTFLMNHYEDGDKVYLFGFSRGAYTVRCVCSLLYMYGLIHGGNDPLVPYAVRMMMGMDRAGRETDAAYRAAAENYFRLANDFKTTMCRSGCKPHFVGVWDTVSSVGWKDNPLKLPYTADNPDIAIGRHAIAIDEKRAFFRTNRWVPSRELEEHGPKDVKQVWFAGVHSDVGGGYPEKESGLAKIALEWMLEEAKAAGLLVDPGRQAEILGLSLDSKYTKPDPDGGMHESLKGAWKIAEFIPKPHYDWKTGTTQMQQNRGRRRTIPPGSLVHESVFQRQKGEYAKIAGIPDTAKPIATVRYPATGAQTA